MAEFDNIRIFDELEPKVQNLIEELRTERLRQGKTTKQLVDETGISKSVLDRFSAGTLKHYEFLDICTLCVYFDIPLEQRLGITAPSQDESNELSHLQLELDHQAELIVEKDKAIDRLQERSRLMESGITARDGQIRKQEEDLRRKDKDITAARKTDRPLLYGMCGLCVLLATILLVYIVLDAQNPTQGLIRSNGMSAVIWVGASCILVILILTVHFVVSRWYQKGKER